MPEQLLARIIRTSSDPYDLVLDPFGGSGTTLCVAKKLRRNWMGFELSKDYVKHIRKRLDQTTIGDAIDGPDDPIESAPQTAKGKKRRKQAFDDDTIQAVIESYETAGDGFPADYILCDKDLNKKFIKACLKRGIGGNAIVWNRLMLKLRKSGKLPTASRRPQRMQAEDLNQYGYASEVAWRLVSDEFQVPGSSSPSLDEILCCPDTAEYFDRIAMQYGPQDSEITSLQYRRAALAIRKRDKDARKLAKQKFVDWSSAELLQKPWKEFGSKLTRQDSPGVFLIRSGKTGVYAGGTDNLHQRLTELSENPNWQAFELDAVFVAENGESFSHNTALKSILFQQESPLLNVC